MNQMVLAAKIAAIISAIATELLKHFGYGGIAQLTMIVFMCLFGILIKCAPKSTSFYFIFGSVLFIFYEYCTL